MAIIIGLGNPGQQYKNTRHNVGFMAVDELAVANGFPKFGLQKKSESLVSDGSIGGIKVLLAKPQTFMNESGKAVQKLLQNRPEAQVIVIHDDIDLPIGELKIVKGRGSAGHKGVESVIRSIGNENLVRIRIGINSQSDPKAMDVVLKNFSAAEKENVDQAIKKSTAAIKTILEDGIDKAMNEYN